jgi:hypothetical protein
MTLSAILYLATSAFSGIFKMTEVDSSSCKFFIMMIGDIVTEGFPDIVYTCGDNADFSTVLKPYHGVYIYINDGSNHFKQQYFFPMHGCFKAMARDFDGDGDLDMAAISFFADYANRGKFDFQPYSIPETTSGRWLTMDAADIDGDGKVDLVLGNFSIAPTFVKGAVNWKQGPPLCC